MELSPEPERGLLLYAVSGVLSENLRMVFLRRLHLISLSFEKLVLSVGERMILTLRMNLEWGGGGSASVGLAWVSIQPLISQETTFLLLERRSSWRRVLLKGEFIAKLTDL
jgi:hypothetical protein